MSAYERTQRLHGDLADAVKLYFEEQKSVDEPFVVYELEQGGESVPQLNTGPTLIIYLLERLLSRIASHEELMRFLEKHREAMQSTVSYRRILYTLERYNSHIQWEKLKGSHETQRKNPPRGELIPFPN